MTDKRAFGTKDLIKCLKCLGFKRSSKQTGTSHIKFDCPKDVNIPIGVRPFIIVIKKKGAYRKNAQNSYITQISRFGFPKKDILKNL